jgi:predicted Ser/Thr protein kinase
VRRQQPPPVLPEALRVGDYRLLTQIGEGGMGVVHLAQAPNGARVALKVLRPHIVGDDEARERLAREVASLQRVRSPRVAEVIDADPWGALPYVATRYVPGLSLHEHVRRYGPLVGSDLRHFAAGLAEAVIAVHQVGVLHRDIKPSNVLLEGRSPVLIDFGLARLAEDPRLTQTGWFLGTPGYLAPEILYGEDATTASDVHSWAATVVFAATGRPPFGTGPAMAIMDRVRRGEHDLSGVPVALLPLVRACLAPDPADRPETAAVLAALRPRVPDGRTEPSAPSDPTMPFVLAPAPARDEQVTLTVAPATSVLPLPPAAVGRPRPQRAVVLLGLFGTVSVGFAAAPYLALSVLGILALLLRTVSWTTESARERQSVRGRRRWFDPLLTIASLPWYLVVATGGTLMLLFWAALVALVVGVAYLLFGAPLVPGLLLMGAALALCLWWGPGSRRLRVPTRRLLLSGMSRAWLAWACVAVVAIAGGLCAYALVTNGVSWEPAPGAPWRPGTVLDDVVRWL